MNVLKISFAYLNEKPIVAFVNTMMIGLGFGILIFLHQFNTQSQMALSRNLAGTDLVVSAKGSPMQIVLCNVFHLDVPTGNISQDEADRIAGHPLVKSSTKISLGDSYKNFRIVGADDNFANWYETDLEEGRSPSNKYEIALGANVAQILELKVGDKIVSNHGLESDGESHEEELMISGIFQPSSSKFDFLIVTSHETVRALHHLDDQQNKEVTAILLRYKNPIAAMRLPGWINKNTSLQAASPAFELSRLYELSGVGIQILNILAYVILLSGIASLFTSLYNLQKEKSYDLALMRSMGASKRQLVSQVILEALLIGSAGMITGLIISQIGLLSMNLYWPAESGITFILFHFGKTELILVLGGMLVAIVAALIPAIKVYRMDISSILAKEG